MRTRLSVFIVLVLIGAFLNSPATTAGSGTWQQLQNVPNFNPNHEILLTDGSVLFGDNGPLQAGSPGWYLLQPDSQGSYVNGSWTQVASMPNNYSPANAASGVLPDGRVIVEGGDMNGTSTYVGENLGAIYDPIANTWTMVSPPNNGQGEFASISDAPSAILSDGTFMIGPSGNGSSTDTNQQEVALLDETSMTWKVIEPTGRKGMNPEAGFNLLPNGNVLTIPTNIPDLKISEIFNPSTDTWSSQPLPVSLIDPITTGAGGNDGEIGPATLLPDGKLFAEGSNGNTAIYDTNSGIWSTGPAMPTVNGKVDTAVDAPSAILPDGNLLMELSPIDPSRGDSTTPAHFFIFDGSSITQIVDPPSGASLDRVGSNSGRMIVLPNGQALFNARMGSQGLFVYSDAGKPNSAWLPTITNVAKDLIANSTYTLAGTQLAGLTSGSNFGDDWNPNTNYPLVQITNNATGEVSYARTFDIGSYSVAPGIASSTKFQLPIGIRNGPSSLRVIASGFASKPVMANVSGGIPLPT
ncbi:MAG TPA: hypothetical protein VIH79_05430, partial [Candidatus Nanopelagicaceae bacterium]